MCKTELNQMVITVFVVLIYHIHCLELFWFTLQETLVCLTVSNPSVYNMTVHLLPIEGAVNPLVTAKVCVRLHSN